jgi:uncharacterized protein
MKLFSTLPSVVLFACCVFFQTSAPAISEDKASRAEKALKGLLITGGCCHNYTFQSKALTEGISSHGSVEWTIVHEGGNGTHAQIPLYDNPEWAAPYDVVVHNECFAATSDPDYIEKILQAHRKGKPAVVVHCAMHTYRSAKGDEWRQFLGVTSRSHEHQSRYPVVVMQPEHPVMKGIPGGWITPKDELYVVEKTWPETTVLATSASEKNGVEHPVIWVNNYHGVRVFGTTYGHSDDTFRDPVFIRLLANGFFWAAGRDQ